ncbi:MAG: hypothetical protein JEZ07_13790 [Phycisphaerae bacterium]|nr:hypothetical protein [Phycisphaerae bacterium]
MINYITIGILILALLAEWLHSRRCRRLASLAFGPTGRPFVWARFMPLVRIGAMTALAWSLMTLYSIDPKVLKAEDIPREKKRHIVIALDVSPSMKLEDAGAKGAMTRSARASEVLFSIFSRIAMDQALVSVVAVYNGAVPVFIDTDDLEVVRNVLDDLPMDIAFNYGKTKLIDGVNKVAELTEDWPDKSTTVLIVSDGDTLPDSGMEKMPDSVNEVLVIGVGNPKRGIFIDGHQSRQDSSALKQLARRVNGKYCDANIKQVPTDAIEGLADDVALDDKVKMDKRQLALVLLVTAATVLAVMPLVLQILGSDWHRHIRKGEGDNA